MSEPVVGSYRICKNGFGQYFAQKCWSEAHGGLWVSYHDNHDMVITSKSIEDIRILIADSKEEDRLSAIRDSFTVIEEHY